MLLQVLGVTALGTPAGDQSMLELTARLVVGVVGAIRQHVRCWSSGRH